MSKKWIAASAAIVLLAAGIGYGVYYFQYRSFISEVESLFREGSYKTIVEILAPQMDPDAVAPEKRLILGKAYYRLGEFENARQIIDPLLRYGREKPEAVALSGWLWLKTKGLLQAQDIFTRLDYPDVDMSAVRDAGLGAVALVRSDRFRKVDMDEAFNLLTNSIASGSPPTEAYLYLAEYDLIQHNYENASKYAQRAVDQDPFWSEPHVLLGRCYLQTGDFSRAQKAFETALRYGASEMETNYYLARSLYLQGQSQKALAVFEEVAKQDSPLAGKAAEDAAKIHILLGGEAKAIALFEQSTRSELRPSAGMQLFQLYMRNGHKDKAFSLLQEIVSNWPLSADAQLEMGNYLLREGNAKRAYSSFQNVLDDDPQNCRANYNLGCISVMLGQQFQAPDFFDLSSRFYADFFEGKVNFALSLLAVDREAEGRQILQDLSYETTSNPMVLQAQALERFLAGFPEVSLKRISDSLEQTPDRSAPFIIRGEILMRLFQFEEAKQSFRLALAKDPQNVRALLGLAHISYRLGNDREAEDLYNDLYNLRADLYAEMVAEIINGKALQTARGGDYLGALDLWDQIKLDSELGRQLSIINRTVASGEPPNALALDDLSEGLAVKNPLPEMLFNFALLSARFGNADQAIEWYEKLTAEYPSYLPGMVNLAELHLARHGAAKAVELYTRASKAAPDHIDVANNLAAAQLEANNFPAANEGLDNAQALEPLDSTVAFNRSLLAMKHGDTQEARKRLNAVRSELGQSSRLQLLDGLMMAADGDWDKAAEALKQPIRSETLEPYRMINYGIGLAKQGKLKQAESVLLEVRTLAPELADAHRSLGLLYCQLGLHQIGLDALRQSLRLDPTQEDLSAIVKQVQSWIRA